MVMNISGLPAIWSRVPTEDPLNIEKNARMHERYWAIAFRMPSTTARLARDRQSTIHILRASIPVLRLAAPKFNVDAQGLYRATGAGPQRNTKRESIPLIPLDSELQRHFNRMRRTVMNTCHPQEINIRAHDIVNSITFQPDAERRVTAVHQWAQVLFDAGAAREKYTRTVAVLVHDVLAELYRYAGETQRPGEMHWELQDALLNLAVKTFLAQWEGAGPSAQDVPGPEDDLAPEFLVAAFLGDLFALGVLSPKQFCHLVQHLLANNSSTAYCHALYLLFLHAGSHIGEDLPTEWLHECRKTLVLKATNILFFINNDMAKRWYIESCNVIDALLEEQGQIMTVASHCWFHELTLKDIAELLEQPQQLGDQKGPSLP